MIAGRPRRKLSDKVTYQHPRSQAGAGQRWRESINLRNRIRDASDSGSESAEELNKQARRGTADGYGQQDPGRRRFVIPPRMAVEKKKQRPRVRDHGCPPVLGPADSAHGWNGSLHIRNHREMVDVVERDEITGEVYSEFDPKAHRKAKGNVLAHSSFVMYGTNRNYRIPKPVYPPNYVPPVKGERGGDGPAASAHGVNGSLHVGARTRYRHEYLPGAQGAGGHHVRAAPVQRRRRRRRRDEAREEKPQHAAGRRGHLPRAKKREDKDRRHRSHYGREPEKKATKFKKKLPAEAEHIITAAVLDVEARERSQQRRERRQRNDVKHAPTQAKGERKRLSGHGDHVEAREIQHRRFATVQGQAPRHRHRGDRRQQLPRRGLVVKSANVDPPPGALSDLSNRARAPVPEFQ